MNLWTAGSFALLIAIIGITINVIDAIGADHLEKRALLRRVAILSAYVAVAFTAGWLTCWISLRPDRDGNPNANGNAAHEATKAEPENAQITHEKPPSQPQNKPSISAQNNSSQSAAQKKPPPDPRTHKHPTPAFIAKTLDDAAPVAWQKVKEQFIGVPISWDGKLQGSSKHGDITFIEIASDGDDLEPTFGFRAPIELPKHNFLLQAKKGTHLHVEAVIEDIPGTYYYIALKDVSVIELKDK